MMKQIQKILFALVVLFGVASCTKEPDIIEEPKPQEFELITTVRVKATNANNSTDVKVFNYKVENGFHSGTVDFQVDDIILAANTVYNIEMFVLDETNTPPYDVTDEIIQERNSHLFYYESTPDSGAGSITVSDRDKDDNGQDFARVCKWQTGASGTGELKITLIHGPRNKDATTREGVGGGADAEVIYPVRLN